MSVLSPYRVLDLTTERGLICGQMLADMGADVIKVEPVGGSSARGIGPFYQDAPHPDRSLYWWAYNRNKRAITLDLERDAGRDLLVRLVERADFLIESHNPGYLSRHHLGFADLAKINPALIYVSITPFGQDGPKAGYADSDLIIMAASGPLILAGDADRPPRAAMRPASVLTCIRRRGGGGARGSSRAHALGPRTTHRRRGAAIGCDGDAVVHPRGAARRDGSAAHVGRRQDGPDRSATGVAGQRRLHRDDVSVRLGARRVHRQAHALPLRAGLLRRSHARQGLDRIRRAVIQRRRAAGGIRSRQASRPEISPAAIPRPSCSRSQSNADF